MKKPYVNFWAERNKERIVSANLLHRGFVYVIEKRLKG